MLDMGKSWKVQLECVCVRVRVRACVHTCGVSAGVHRCVFACKCMRVCEYACEHQLYCMPALVAVVLMWLQTHLSSCNGFFPF